MPRAKLAKVSVEELKKEILRRQRALPKLIAKRDAVNCQIAELEALGAARPAAKLPKRARRKAGRRARRGPRAGSLASALVEALKGKRKVSVGEAAGAVQAAGYKSKSKDFPNIVSMTLSHGRQFRRVGRGLYALKG